MHHHKRLFGFALLLAVLAGCGGQHAQHAANSADASGPTTRDGRLSPLLGNLGNFRRTVSTKSPEAQKYFTQGLTLIYGFNHAEAIRSFQEAQRNDAALGMAYWGEALAVGPNINDAAEAVEREKQAYAAAQKAVENKAGETPVEQALIDAIAVRFSHPEGANREKRMQAYADAMEAVYQRFPDDPDVGALYAAAVMDTMPWNYYLQDGRPKPPVVKAIAALENAMKLAPDHPGAHHYYIHAVEASPDPDRAIPSADKLGRLVPGAGHLVHMPAHIYIRVGRYQDAVQSNLDAIAADESYITQCRVQGIYPAAYYPHNIHFLTAALAMEGRGKELMDAANKVAAHHDHGAMNIPGFGFPHVVKTMPVFAMVRMGMWDRMLAEPQPEHSAFALAIWHYGRGMAAAARNDLDAARKELALYRTAAAQPSLNDLMTDANTLAEIAAIGVDVLEGEIASRRKDHARAIAAFQRAVDKEDALRYSEPPDWPNPPRHNLGAALLRAGRYRDAEKVFRKDLERHRNNGWALMGLAKSLNGQGRKKEAAEIQAQFDKAWARADAKIESSVL